MRGGWAEFRQRGRIYRLAVPVLKKAYNLVISSRSRAGTAKKFQKSVVHVQSCCFCLQNLLLFDVTVAVAVTVIVSPSKCLPDSRRYHRFYLWKEALSCIRFCSGKKAIGYIECEHRWSVDEVKRFIYIGKLSHLQKLLFITSNERLIIQSGRIVKHLAEKSTIHWVKVYWFR